MNIRLHILTVLSLLAICVVRTDAQVTEYVLRYEAVHYASFLEVMQHHVVTQTFDGKNLEVSIYSYRLDQKKEYGESPDSVLFGKTTFGLEGYHSDSLKQYRENLQSLPTARALANHSLEYFGKVDTIAGLPSYCYIIEADGNREYLGWLAEAPQGIADLLLWQALEYPKRGGSFLMEEELCTMIRLILLRGVEFPPNSANNGKAFIITRFDTSVYPEIMNVRGNSYLYELKSLTGGLPVSD